MSAKQLLLEATRTLAHAGCDTPRLDAECLLANAWGISRTQLIMRMLEPVPEHIAQRFQAMVARRARREPLAYITGRQEFWSRSFTVNRHTLIPRPETEHLIEAALRHLPNKERPWYGWDIGTGSGCIAITLACEYPNATILASDISLAALRVAQANARRHGVLHRMRWLCADMLQPIAANARFQLIIANPPYVAGHELPALAPELGFEPIDALTDHADGLRHLTRILRAAPRHLAPGGRIIVETGTCGLPATPEGMECVEEIRDLAGRLRGAVYRSR